MVSSSHNITISAETSIADLVRHVQKRDANARASFEELYMRYSRSILGHIQYLVRDKRVAEELHNDTFLAAWNSLGQKNPDIPLEFDPWIHRIAANCAIDYLRHEKKYKFFPLPEEEPGDEYQFIPPLASGELGTEEQICDLDSVEQLLNHVSPTARLCLVLHVQWGLSQKEIAELLGGIDPRRVNDYIRRARNPLRHLYPHLMSRSKQKKEV